MPSRRVLFLTSGPNAPTTRYRILPYLPRLERMGWRCDVAHSRPEKYDWYRPLGWRGSQWLKRTVRRWHWLLARWRRYDVIVIEREIFDNPSWNFEEAFRRVTDRLVLDIDDAVFLRYPEKFGKIAALCDAIVAGNNGLAEVSRRACPRVTVIPTAIDLADYPCAPAPERSGPPVIGWIGTPANVPYLKEALPALRGLHGIRPFVFRVITSRADVVRALGDEVPIEFRQWRADSAIDEIRDFDIGVMPLPEGDWERYKCGFKLLQYMACGKAAVASPVGVNAEIVEHGVNGMLATSTADWTRALDQLLADPESRRRLGQAARRTVESRYSVDGHAATYAAVLSGEATPLVSPLSAASTPPP